MEGSSSRAAAAAGAARGCYQLSSCATKLQASIRPKPERLSSAGSGNSPRPLGRCGATAAGGAGTRVGGHKMVGGAGINVGGHKMAGGAGIHVGGHKMVEWVGINVGGHRG